ncbi:MAG TPA: hypothetical protein VMG35_30105 [Bryobacteraceae bacterium]|nr:hypothetical protein [Bryobacteraceae bacterium]
MRNSYHGITVVITVVMASGFLATAQSTPAESNPPQYFTYNLPAGASLISSPLDTGTGLAFNTFLGLPAGWPLFYGWSSNTQSFVPADQAPAGLGHGFWTYLPEPTTLAVAGQPFNFLTSVTMHAPPGWHLFGVPYVSGINWSDFKVYFAGNPIGLDTAIANGWIDSGVQTMQGDQATSLLSGQQFQPGTAYWVHTTMPLDVRADAAPTTTGNTASTTGTTGETTASATVAGTTTTAGTTSQSAAGWMATISSSLGDAGEAAAAFAEGNVFSGTFDLLAGGFDLLEHALDPNTTTPDPTSQLTQIDTKLDTLLDDVGAVSQQLTGLEQAVSGLGQQITSDTALGEPMTNAATWLQNNYNSPFSTSSRQWARWQLAGCQVTATACPEANNPVTSANLTAFESQYLTQKGNPTQTADYPLWWSESVIGGWSPAAFQDGGQTAKSYVTQIWQGLTAGITSPATANGNGLMAYMQYNMSSSGCAADPSYSDVGGSCDLYKNVYQRVEDYFSQAISEQTQLAAAIVESYGVLTEEKVFPAGAAQTFMTGFTQQVNQEAEAFLQVAEQIALYRAADGVHDWNTFPSTDAGQLLARADFVVMQLAGNNFQYIPQAGWFNPPWPLLGGLIVGRVFYAHGETPLSANATRDACPQTDGAFCGAPAFQISENVATQRVVKGPPYFLWTPSSGNIAQGTAYTDWTIQRIVPSWQQPGLFLVNSTQPGNGTQKSRGGAPLDVRLYNQNYSDEYPPSVTTEFASLNSVEGAVGPYGLFLPAPYWAWSGGGNNKAHQSASPTYGTQTCGLTVNYINDALDSNGTVGFNWSESQKIQFTMPSGYTHVKVTWPAQATIAVGAAPLPNSGSYASQAYPYWQSMTFSQQVLGSNGSVATPNGSYSTSPCPAPYGGGNFNNCNYSNTNQSFTSGQILVSGQGAQQFTLKATYSDTVVPTTTVGCLNRYGCFVGVNPTNGSQLTWTLTFPSVTILP